MEMAIAKHGRLATSAGGEMEAHLERKKRQDAPSALARLSKQQEDEATEAEIAAQQAAYAGERCTLPAAQQAPSWLACWQDTARGSRTTCIVLFQLF